MTSEHSKPVKTEMDERVELSMLYDFYGALLKENQREMFEAYIQDDYLRLRRRWALPDRGYMTR